MASNSTLPALVNQPNFAPQLQTIRPALGQAISLQRGYMIWSQPMTTVYSGGGPLGDGRDMIKFMFNPSTVSTDYNIANASLQAAMMYTVPGDQGNLLAPLMQTVSWELYFDRTYELNYGGNSSAANDPAIIGCQADVYQFMQFTGVLASLNKSQATAVFGAPGGTQVPVTSGIMMMIPSYVFFGSAVAQLNTNVSSSNFNAVPAQMNFYGYISEWSVTYTHWTSSMVPIRCSIAVNFTMLPDPPASTQTAVWKDLNQLGQLPSTAPIPIAPGSTPPPVIFPGSGNGF